MRHMSSAVTYSFIVSREKALFTPIDHLRNATTTAQSLASTRVAAETYKHALQPR